jgi:hypothetical protein
MLALAALGLAAPAAAQQQTNEEIRRAAVGTVGDGARQFRCAPGQYLYGIALNHTDRVVGLWYYCRGASDQGLWTEEAYQTRALGRTDGPVTEMVCPRDYFLVGLAATTGQYQPDSNGMAQVRLPRMLADLQPVCRHRQDAEVYKLNRSYFAGGEDNDLQDVFWQGPGEADCAANQAASGLAVNFERGTSADLSNAFYGIALICRPLQIEPISTGTEVVRTPTPAPLPSGAEEVPPPPPLPPGADRVPPPPPQPPASDPVQPPPDPQAAGPDSGRTG